MHMCINFLETKQLGYAPAFVDSKVHFLLEKAIAIERKRKRLLSQASGS